MAYEKENRNKEDAFTKTICSENPTSVYNSDDVATERIVAISEKGNDSDWALLDNSRGGVTAESKQGQAENVAIRAGIFRWQSMLLSKHRNLPPVSSARRFNPIRSR